MNNRGKEMETEYRGLKIRAVADLHRECISIIKQLALGKDSKVLDLGSGEGAFCRRLLDNGYDVTAMELVPGRFQVDVTCHEQDLNFDFKDKLSEKFDLIVAIEIIEHLQNPRHFIAECIGLLKEDGFLLLTSPNLESWYSRIQFFRGGRFLWFNENDYISSGHITPIFTWQVVQICKELNTRVEIMAHTQNELLYKYLGNGWLNKLLCKSTYMSALSPLMEGWKKGEINIFVIRKNTS